MDVNICQNLSNCTLKIDLGEITLSSLACRLAEKKCLSSTEQQMLGALRAGVLLLTDANLTGLGRW